MMDPAPCPPTVANALSMKRRGIATLLSLQRRLSRGRGNRLIPSSSDANPKLLPIGARSVVGMHLHRPLWICHGWPVVLVEARGPLQRFLIYVKDEAFVVGIQIQRPPRYGEQLITHTQKSAEGQYRVSDFPIRNVEHDRIDLAQCFAFCIDNVITGQRACCHYLRTGPFAVIQIGLIADNAPVASIARNGTA